MLPGAQQDVQRNVGAAQPTGVGGPSVPSSAQPTTPAGPAPIAAQPALTQAGFTGFAADRMPDYAWPRTPVPREVEFDTTLVGDATRGRALVTLGSCLGCHKMLGEPTMIGVTGPDLTHIGSRLTIAGGLFPNDRRHLGAWLKNSRLMKPGVLMPTQGRGQYDPVLKTRLTTGYTDQQIADMVAYLLALK